MKYSSTPFALIFLFTVSIIPMQRTNAQEVRTLEGHSDDVNSVAFSPDGRRIVSGSKDNTIKLWEAETGRELQSLEGHSDWVSSVAFSPDGHRIVSGSDDNTLKVWDAESGWQLYSLEGHSDWVSSVAFSPDGSRIVSGSSDETIKLWETETGRELRTLEGYIDWVTSVVFSPDGRRIVSGSGDNFIKLWETETGRVLRILIGHSASVWSVAFSPDGSRIVSGSSDNTIKLWETETGRLLRTLQGHSDWVNNVAFSPDGRRIVSGSRDETLKLWALFQKPSSPPQLTFQDKSLQFKDSNANNRLDADEMAHITFTLANHGKGVAQGLQMEVEQENKIRGLSYELISVPDKIEPGEKKEFMIELEGSHDIATGKATFTINVKEHFGFDAPPVSITIPTREFQPPRPVIVDHVFTAPATGKMQKGVSINLKLAVQNRGKNTAEDVTVSVTNPQNVLSAGKDQFNLEQLKPDQSKFITYTFFTNNRYQERDVPIKVSVQESYNQYGETQTFTATLEESLQQSATLTVEAQDEELNEYEDVSLLPGVDRNIPNTQLSNPDAIAVVIGNRRYQGDTPDVDFAVNDARIVKKYLINTLGFRERNIIYEENASKTRMEVLLGDDRNPGRLASYLKEGRSDVFFFYSGHGAPDPNTETGYLMPVDADPTALSISGYPLDVLYDNLGKLQARSVSVVIDACFSGGSGGGDMLIQQASPIGIKIKNPAAQLEDGFVVTASSGSQISSWYPEKGHGLLTYFYLKGLQGEADANDDGRITGAEMKQYLTDPIDGLPHFADKLHNRQQIPQVFGNEEKVLIQYEQ